MIDKSMDSKITDENVALTSREVHLINQASLTTFMLSKMLGPRGPRAEARTKTLEVPSISFVLSF